MGKDVVKKGARRWLRPALWTIFGVWAVIIIVLQIALNSKVLTRVVNDVAKEYVDGDVTFTGIKASMFKSFPNLNVTIDNFSITYYAPQPRAVLRIVDPKATNNTVDYDAWGRVELTTLTKEFFMPRFLERDEAIRRPHHAKYPWDGVGDVRPFGALTGKVIEGVY